MKKEKSKKRRFFCLKFECGHIMPIEEIKGNIYEYLKKSNRLKKELKD